MDFENKQLRTAEEIVNSSEGGALEQKWAEEKAGEDTIDPEEIADQEAYAIRVAGDDKVKLAQVRAELGLEQPTEAEQPTVAKVETNLEKPETSVAEAPEQVATPATKTMEAQKVSADSISSELNEMISSGDLAGAESLLLEKRDKFGADWLDHQSHHLFHAHLQEQNWDSAKRMIALANGPLPMEGRRKKLQIDSGQQIEPQAEINYQDQVEANEQHEALESTNDFRDAVLAGRLGEAEDWLVANKNKKKYDTTWLDHRSGELFEAYRALGRLDDAEKMIAYSSDDNSRNGRKGALEIDRTQLTAETNQELGESNIEQVEDLKNTDGFDAAIGEGRLAEAEAWIMEAKDGKYAGNERWFRLQTEKLFRLYRDGGDLPAAKRMTEALPEGEAKEGRKRNLNHIAKKPYEEI